MKLRYSNKSESINHIVIVSEKIEFEFCRALVNIINMQQKEKRT